MSGLTLQVEWLPEPRRGEAAGPERATWGRLEILVNGKPVTSNHPADWPGPEARGVVGGMSGLADWMVENLLPLRFEEHTPFVKSPAFDQRRGGRFPTLRDAAIGWREFASERDGITGNELGAWQQRHTLGAATSDIALPSMVFVPEGPWTGIGLDHLPAHLGPTVRFSPPGAPDDWPAPPIWVPSADVSMAFDDFIGRVLARAKRSPEHARWVAWMEGRWHEALAQAQDPEVVRRWKLGPLVAREWKGLQARLREGAVALEGVLLDAATIEKSATLNSLAALVSKGAGPRRKAGLDLGPIDWGMPAFHQGYRLAQSARKALDLGDGPISDTRLEDVLGNLDIEHQAIPAAGLFRSACWTRRDGAMLVWAGDDPMLAKREPRRFAIAAALARLLTSGTATATFGAAHGEQARIRPTQLANAFAAEFLLPVQAMQKSEGEIGALARRHGISASAATWHVRNRAAQLEA